MWDCQECHQGVTPDRGCEGAKGWLVGGYHSPVLDGQRPNELPSGGRRTDQVIRVGHVPLLHRPGCTAQHPVDQALGTGVQAEILTGGGSDSNNMKGTLAVV